MKRTIAVIGALALLTGCDNRDFGACAYHDSPNPDHLPICKNADGSVRLSPKELAEITKAQFAYQEEQDRPGMKVNLPVAQSGETWPGGDYISISVDANGNPYFGKTEMTYDALFAKLKQVHDENPEAKVFIRGDADTVHFNTIRILDILRSVGFYKVAFEVKSEDSAPQPMKFLMKFLRVALPSTQAAPPQPVKDYVSIRVGAGNAVSFDGQYVTDDEIMSRLYRLHEANPNIKISISAEGMARHGDVITVLDKVRRAGIQKVGYQIRAAQGGPAAAPGTPGAPGAPPPPPPPPQAGLPGTMSISGAKAVAIFAPKPDYPHEARSRHVTGSGVALLTVDADSGNVTDVSMAQSTGSPILDNSIVSTFRHWRFQPGKFAPKVKVPITYTMTGASY